LIQNERARRADKGREEIPVQDRFFCRFNHRFAS
jgi:hypothetical protein